MNNSVFVKTYEAPPNNRNEILRYMGAKKTNSELEKNIDNCLSSLSGKLTYRVCYAELPVSLLKDTVDFSFAFVKSDDLAKNLSGCSKALFFGATVGIEIDRYINKYKNISPVKALIAQAYGAERIESLCDAFCKDVKSKHFTKPRFSPGYGDLPVLFQKEIFRILDCSRKIGLTLNESLIMTPSKSVTAIIGISDSPCSKENQGCGECNKKDCEFRRSL